jgi:hypothetical protein
VGITRYRAGAPTGVGGCKEDFDEGVGEGREVGKKGFGVGNCEQAVTEAGDEEEGVFRGLRGWLERREFEGCQTRSLCRESVSR